METNDVHPCKRPRHFVARQACDQCRAKKTRCDEDFPCSQCRNSGFDCRYANRKATRKEESLSVVVSYLRRIEAKVDTISTQSTEQGSPGSPHDDHINHSTNSGSTSQQIGITANVPAISEESSPTLEKHIIPFSAHQILSWPTVRSRFPPEAKALFKPELHDYAAVLEWKRRPRAPYSKTHDVNLLGSISVALVTELCQTYFATFNLAYPILDRKYFQQITLSGAMTSGFGHNIESCVVLAAMALGCWGKRALGEAGFESDSKFTSELRQHVDGEAPGLSFFEESRNRIGFLLGDKSLQGCQYHLLSSLFYAQSMRPLQTWDSIEQASACSFLFWRRKTREGDTWVADLQSRLYWCTLMSESIWSDELCMPMSRLSELQDQVPLPKFLNFTGFDSSDEGDEDESLCHYHFLAQIAHRTFLSRVKESIYYSSAAVNYPSLSLERELAHQLEQWHTRLPDGIKFDLASSLDHPVRPHDIFVVPWLRARYVIAKWHMGRPLLHRVLAYPEKRTSADLLRCKEVLATIIEYEPIARAVYATNSCLPLKFHICCQLFSHVVALYCFHTDADPRMAEAIPSDYKRLCHFALEVLSQNSSLSPTVRRDYEIARILCVNFLN